MSKILGLMIRLPVLRQLIRFVRRAALMLLGLTAGLVLSLAVFHPGWPTANLPIRFGLPAATAQRLRVEEIWQQVYQQLPELPLENQYVNDETGEVSSNNTLVSRLIRYHIYIKGRPTSYRLDWKLTLADYLGANERMNEEIYPSGTALRINPMTSDITAIRNLSRAQREALVDALVGLFNPAAANPLPVAPSPSPSPSAAPSPTPRSPSRFPPPPQPGDAQLLQP